jgi:hypothetical protein
MTAAAPVFTVGDMHRTDLERLEDEIAEIKATLSTLRPGVDDETRNTRACFWIGLMSLKPNVMTSSPS